MTKGKSGKGGSSGRPSGVWNRGSKRGPANPIRVRTKRLEEIDADKLALAFWLLAKQQVENGTGIKVDPEEAKRVSRRVDETSRNAAKKRGSL